MWNGKRATRRRGDRIISNPDEQDYDRTAIGSRLVGADSGAFCSPLDIGETSVTQPQEPVTVSGLFMLVTLLPALGWILSVIPMKYYHFIDDERAQAHRDILLRRGETADTDAESDA
jgi:Na+/melibiose symporter-like transporter